MAGICRLGKSPAVFLFISSANGVNVVQIPDLHSQKSSSTKALEAYVQILPVQTKSIFILLSFSFRTIGAKRT